MDRRAVITLVGAAVVALLLIFVVLVATDSDQEAGSPTVEECAAAEEVVDTAEETVSGLTTASDVIQDANYYAALVVEQRTITFVMEAEPQCFSLARRAGAEGLLEAFRGLLAVAEPPPEDIVPVAPIPEGEPGG